MAHSRKGNLFTAFDRLVSNPRATGRQLKLLAVITKNIFISKQKSIGYYFVQFSLHRECLQKLNGCNGYCEQVDRGTIRTGRLIRRIVPNLKKKKLLITTQLIKMFHERLE